MVRPLHTLLMMRSSYEARAHRVGNLVGAAVVVVVVMVEVVVEAVVVVILVGVVGVGIRGVA